MKKKETQQKTKYKTKSMKLYNISIFYQIDGFEMYIIIWEKKIYTDLKKVKKLILQKI
jgi:hypothetical protein